MIEGGQTFMTEYPPATAARAGTFPERNRLVAGMSWGTVVVEAAARSGSLITAGLALDYGREVMAVPGPITSEYSEGTKQLLSSGATLVSSGAEIIAQLRGELGAMDDGSDERSAGQGRPTKNSLLRQNWEQFTQEQRQLLSCLQQAPLGLTLEQLQMETQLPVAELQSQISVLTLGGWLKVESELVQLL